jgi:O-methyltransferase domain
MSATHNWFGPSNFMLGFELVVDVGGGNGHILAAILAQYPQLRGALFDLPPTANVACGFLAERGLTDRSEVFAGDFFDSMPPDYDAYMLKSCLHDWQDTKAVEILRRCREAMPDHGRVLIVEIVLAPGRLIDGDPWREGALRAGVRRPRHPSGATVDHRHTHRWKFLFGRRSRRSLRA